MDVRTLIWTIIIILVLIFRSRYRSKKPTQQNPSPQDNPTESPSSQPKRRTLEDVFRDVETRTKPFGDRNIPKKTRPVTAPAKAQKPVSKPPAKSERVMAESAPVPYGEISDTDINKTQIGSANEGGKQKPVYSFTLKDAMIASFIVSRRNFNEVPQEDAGNPIFNRP